MPRPTSWLVPSYVVLCDHDAARETIGQLSAIATRLSQPFLHHVAEHYTAAIALSDGDLAASELAAIRSQEWGRLLTGRDASGTFAIQMFGLRREQGRLAELAPVVRLLDAETREGAWSPGLVALYAELGMEDEARRELDRILEAGLGTLRPSLWLAALVYLADACAARRGHRKDRTEATLLDLQRTHRGRCRTDVRPVPARRFGNSWRGQRKTPPYP